MPPKPASGDLINPVEVTRDALAGNRDLYRNFSRIGCSYIYPPCALIELYPLGWVARHWGPDRAIQVADICFRLLALATLALATLALAVHFAGPRNRRELILLVLLLGAFFPWRWGMVCVNVQVAITFLLGGMVWLYSQKRSLGAGILLGLAIGLKPYLVLMVLVCLVRRDWRFLAGTILTLALLIGLSLPLSGIDAWKTYIHEILPTLAPGYGFYPNQTLNGIIHRWLGHSTSIEIAPDTLAVKIGTRIGTLLFLLLAVWPRLRRQPVGPGIDSLRRGLDLSLAVLAVTLASPVAWDHYFGFCLILIGLCWRALRNSAGPRRWHGLLGMGCILAGSSWYPLSGVKAVSLLNSPLFFGAMLILLAGWLILRGLVSPQPAIPGGAKNDDADILSAACPAKI